MGSKIHKSSKTKNLYMFKSIFSIGWDFFFNLTINFNFNRVDFNNYYHCLLGTKLKVRTSIKILLAILWNQSWLASVTNLFIKLLLFIKLSTQLTCGKLKIKGIKNIIKRFIYFSVLQISYPFCCYISYLQSLLSLIFGLKLNK